MLSFLHEASLFNIVLTYHTKNILLLIQVTFIIRFFIIYVWNNNSVLLQ